MSLGEAMVALTEGIRAGHAARDAAAVDRVRSVADLRGSTRGQIAGFRQNRAQAVAALRSTLHAEHVMRRAAVQQQLAAADRNLREQGETGRRTRRAEAEERARWIQEGVVNWNEHRRQSVIRLMAAIQDQRAAAARVLQDSLASARRDLQAAVQDKLQSARAEQAQAAAAWAGLTAPPARPAAPARRAVAPSQPAAATAPAAPPPPATVPAPVDDPLRARALAFVNAHPDGVKLTDMEDALGAARIRLANILAQLAAVGAIRKSDRLYLPAVYGGSAAPEPRDG